MAPRNLVFLWYVIVKSFPGKVTNRRGSQILLVIPNLVVFCMVCIQRCCFKNSYLFKIDPDLCIPESNTQSTDCYERGMCWKVPQDWHWQQLISQRKLSRGQLWQQVTSKLSLSYFLQSPLNNIENSQSFLCVSLIKWRQCQLSRYSIILKI